MVLSYAAAVEDACDRVTQLACHRVKYYKPYFIIALGGLSGCYLLSPVALWSGRKLFQKEFPILI